MVVADDVMCFGVAWSCYLAGWFVGSTDVWLCGLGRFAGGVTVVKWVMVGLWFCFVCVGFEMIGLAFGILWCVYVCMLCLAAKKTEVNIEVCVCCVWSARKWKKIIEKGFQAFSWCFVGESGRSECVCCVWLARKWKKRRENKLGIEFFLFYFFRK